MTLTMNYEQSPAQVSSCRSREGMIVEVFQKMSINPGVSRPGL